MTSAYPYPVTQEYVDGVLVKLNTRPPDIYWQTKYDAPFWDFGYRQRLQADIEHDTWWERCEELMDNGYEWPIPWDVSVYEALAQRGLWPDEETVSG